MNYLARKEVRQKRQKPPGDAVGRACYSPPLCCRTAWFRGRRLLTPCRYVAVSLLDGGEWRGHVGGRSDGGGSAVWGGRSRRKGPVEMCEVSEVSELSRRD